MLVLTRKRGETIRIGEHVVIKVIHLGKGAVKLGIEAPAHVRVLRGELPQFLTPPAHPGEPHLVDEELDTEAFLASFNEMFDLTLLADDVALWSPDHETDTEVLELTAKC